MTLRQEIRFARAAMASTWQWRSTEPGRRWCKAANLVDADVELDHASPLDRALIDEFSPRFRYVTYDARGCGLSQRRVDDVSLDASIRDLETVVDALRLETFPLLGISQGAAIAVAYAARHPERVSRLVLLGGFATSYFNSGRSTPEALAEAETLFKLVELGWGSPQPAFRQVFVSRFMPDATTEQRRVFDDLQRVSASPEMAARYLRAMFSLNVRDAAKQVRCPTLALHVKGDQMVYFDQGRNSLR